MMASPTFWLLFIVYIVNKFGESLGQEAVISGCGGFVKSKNGQKLKYDVIQIHLTTLDGTVKDQTECAPHNGYFFVPTYEQGNFKLKIVPPAGWSFEPHEYDVTVSETKTTCEESKDLNFFLTGFAVSGKILTKGATSGPEKINLVLYNKETGVNLETKSAANGLFQFSPVYPGNYMLATDNLDLHLQNEKLPVTVTNDNVVNAGPLVVVGYSVRGSVSTENEPVSGVKFLLFPEAKTKLLKCAKKLQPTDGYVEGKDGQPGCYVESDSAGNFEILALTPGNYKLVPFYNSGKTKFDVKPGEYKLTIQNAPIVITPAFAISGFSVFGTVQLSTSSNLGISQADVFVNGQKVTTTDKNGKFVLEKMTAGDYFVRIEKNRYGFEPSKVHFSPSKPELHTIYVANVEACGSITVQQYPTEIGKSPARKIEIKSRKPVVDLNLETDTDGKFCSMVPISAKIIFKPSVSGVEKKHGLRFHPEFLELSVSDVIQSKDLSFIQRLASVSGKITCFDKCDSGMKVKLVSDSSPSSRAYETTVKSDLKTFIFDRILFDVYKLEIVNSRFCWENKFLSVDAMKATKDSLTDYHFKQTGYVMNIACAFDDVNLSYKLKTNKNISGEIINVRRNSRVCMPSKGEYELGTSSCFKFPQRSESLTIDSSQTTFLELKPELFKVEVSVESPSKDFQVLLSINDRPEEKMEVIAQSKSQIAEIYKINFFAKKGDNLKLKTMSDSLLFHPKVFDYVVMGNGCPGVITNFIGKAGEFLEATMSVATSDVTVEVVNKQGQVIITQIISDKKIRIGPLEDKSLYSLKLSKTGYVFTDNKDSSFDVHKLASISIFVKDELEVPLNGVLMSVSEAERSFRSNSLTNAHGQLSLLNLGPGEYFIKPLRKEYTFSPPNKLISVKEGENSVVDFTALRTAFTCYGIIRTPSLDLKAGVTVVASGVGDSCGKLKEEGVSQPDGFFTILGLQSNCDYEVSVRLDREVEYSIPKVRTVSVGKKDVKDINFVVFPRDNINFDLNGYVDSEPQYLNTLTVNLYHEDQKNAPIESQSLDQVPFFFFTSLAPDEKWYTVRLESSLPKSDYSYNISEHTFQAVGPAHHVKFQFRPERVTGDDDVSQGGLLVPLLIVLAGICMYNYNKVKTHVQVISTSISKSAWMRRANESYKGSVVASATKKKKSVKTH